MFRNSKLKAVLGGALKPLAIALLAGSAMAKANDLPVNVPNDFKAYVEVQVGSQEFGRTLERRVIYFVDFGCRFCREAHGYMVTWGNTLPEHFQFEVVPAIGLEEHFPMAVAYYSALMAAPNRLDAFERELYRLMVEVGRSHWDAATYRRAAERAGIDVGTFERYTQSQEVERYVRRARRLTEVFELDEVPTVVVGGRFKTSPAVVQSDQGMFISLLNGLVSMRFQELGW